MFTPTGVERVVLASALCLLVIGVLLGPSSAQMQTFDNSDALAYVGHAHGIHSPADVDVFTFSRGQHVCYLLVGANSSSITCIHRQDAGRK